MAILNSTVVNGCLAVNGTSIKKNGTEVSVEGHAHGNITSSGTITSAEVTAATGILVYDSNNVIQRATAAQVRTIIGAGTSSLSLAGNGSATTAAKSDHTHTASLTAGGTSTITLGGSSSYTLTAGGSSVIFTMPDEVRSLSFMVDQATNINGQPINGSSGTSLQGYTAVSWASGNYKGYQIKKNNANVTKAQAGIYMNHMTGSNFVPEYNAANPKCPYLLRTEDNLIFKPQFDSANGLILYKMGGLVTTDYEVINNTEYIASKIKIISESDYNNIQNKNPKILYIVV